MSAKVLFLCTGNYYRSRFAEYLFNHEAAKRKLDWTADSRALALELGVNNAGPISSYTLAELRRRGIEVTMPIRSPQQVTEEDLRSATLIIALDRDEHAPMVAQRLPAWVDHIRYWQVADLHLRTADEALGEIARQVDQLLEECSNWPVK